MTNSLSLLITTILLLNVLQYSSSSRSRYLKNIHLVRNISLSQEVEEGGSVELECRLGSVPNRAEVAWVKLRGLGEATFLSTYSKEDGVVEYEDNLTSDMENDEEEAVWSLTLYRVTKNMTGFYQCEVLLNNDPVSSRKVLLTVLDPRKVEHNTKYVMQGGNITLDCTDFEGEEVHWKRLGDNTVVQYGKLLSLIRVDRKDSGVYVCSVDGNSRTMNISLLVHHLPLVSTSMSSVSSSLGHPAHLTCQVTAVPVPAVSWYKLNPSLEPVMIKSQGGLAINIQDYKDGRMISSLMFHNVTQANYGEYSCNATNTVGQASAVLQLVNTDYITGTGTQNSSTLSILMITIVLCSYTLPNIGRI